MHPKVAIIVPCYNQARFLPKAIASIQAQTMPDWECIIIDDGSTDETATIAQTYCEQDKRFRIISKENGGSASARDLGLLHAKGEYIQFLDADDSIAPDKLEEQLDVLEQTKTDICVTAFCFENKFGERSKIHTCRLNLRRVLVSWGLSVSTPIHSFLYRTDFIRKHNIRFQSDCRFREDWGWHIRCFIAQAKSIVMPDYCGAIYYQNEEGKTGSYIRMQEGNFMFMAYMSHQLVGMNKLRWALRISEELWIWALRMIKYRSNKLLSTFSLLIQGELSTGMIIAAILLLPLSFWYIVIYFIRTYIIK